MGHLIEETTGAQSAATGGRGMRGPDGQQAAMFSYVSPEQRVPAEHPLRPIREMTDEAHGVV